MKCPHNKEDLVPIKEDPFGNDSTHQCIGRGAHEQCWKYVKVENEVVTEDPYYREQEKDMKEYWIYRYITSAMGGQLWVSEEDKGEGHGKDLVAHVVEKKAYDELLDVSERLLDRECEINEAKIEVIDGVEYFPIGGDPQRNRLFAELARVIKEQKENL